MTSLAFVLTLCFTPIQHPKEHPQQDCRNESIAESAAGCESAFQEWLVANTKGMPYSFSHGEVYKISHTCKEVK
jgi:hypothetical protein